MPATNLADPAPVVAAAYTDPTPVDVPSLQWQQFDGQ
jgi:hypothetical protein